MEGLLEFVLRDVLTSIGGADRCVSEFIRISGSVLPDKVYLRTMPELAWAVIFVMAFGIGAIPGFLALMLHTVGSLTKLFYEAVESAQNKPVRGLAACGASPLQKIRFALWPQVKPLFLSYGFMRLEINFRSSTILGLVGAGGIGQELMTNIKLDRYDQVSITLLLIILVVSALDMLSGRLRLWVLEGKK